MKRYASLLLSIIVALGAAGAHAHDDHERARIEQWVTAFFESFNRDLNRGDMDAWMENWAAGAERITSMGNARGRAEIRALYADLMGRYEHLEHRILDRIIEGNRASVELMTTGVHRATGREVRIPNVAVLTFDDEGRVSSAHVYLDRKGIDAQIAR